MAELTQAVPHADLPIRFILRYALRIGAVVGSLVISSSALAELPPPVRAMIDAAIANGKPEQVETIIAFARQTNPDAANELNVIQNEYAMAQAELKAATLAVKERELRDAGFFENWTGQGEIGAFRATGNSSNTGITAGIKLTRKGVDWRHKINALIDYQRSNGTTTREQYLLAYEPNYDINDRVFVYALGQYERDRFQGFTRRLSASGGVGYRVLTGDDAQLFIKGGPAYRQTSFVDGTSDTSIAALGALDFDWKIADTITFTQDASAFLQSDNSTFVSTTGLKAGLGEGLSARIAYVVEHDTDPPVGAVKTDTLTRFTLIYGF
ncbi:MAG: DUF481 domain-containing protein [Pontixanthobacter sp.]